MIQTKKYVIELEPNRRTVNDIGIIDCDGTVSVTYVVEQILYS